MRSCIMCADAYLEMHPTSDSANDSQSLDTPDGLSFISTDGEGVDGDSLVSFLKL